MKLSRHAVAACAAIFGMSLALPAATIAQMNQQGTPERSAPRYRGSANPANPSTVDDATLKRAAAAYVKVRDISLKTDKVLSGTTDPASKQKIMAQAESRKIAAVKGQGMQPQQYNQVIMMVRADNALQQRFLSYVRQAKNSPSNTM